MPSPKDSKAVPGKIEGTFVPCCTPIVINTACELLHHTSSFTLLLVAAIRVTTVLVPAVVAVH
ncbi:hypothetical protein EJ05DRAFT_471516 [Pseudovirgaria hyperparasitica]|uniref:Uncharacterized protein n=1 Tax=Pseudovirgaria hyperparasitica TaxID=470096 RepID=A0A6A6WJS7_9PEZI|nr:uncharacterized protein EJ05DRAFT_471516 [Pseudovirgaria hyperparasitica]KAF2762510.1 hypothetical protein EJ05DRAFT_471516 [Pseudovirgaria hyperparasitica]